MIEKQIILKNLLINYYAVESDRRAAKTVIFLHGWRSNGMIWMPLIEGLLGPDRSVGAHNENTSYQLYALDLPGFGKSESPKEPFHLKDYAEIVKEFIEKMRLLTLPSPLARGEGQRERSSIVVVGHSFGGRVAIKLAVEYPEAINKLVLVDCGGFRKSEWKRGLVTFLAKISGPVFALPFLKALRPKVYNILGAEDYLAIPELKSTFLNVINENLNELIAKIPHPTLIIWGEQDEEAPLEYGKFVHFKIQNSIFHILKNAGHFSFLDRPEDFVKELIEFLDIELYSITRP